MSTRVSRQSTAPQTRHSQPDPKDVVLSLLGIMGTFENPVNIMHPRSTKSAYTGTEKVCTFITFGTPSFLSRFLLPSSESFPSQNGKKQPFTEGLLFGRLGTKQSFLPAVPKRRHLRLRGAPKVVQPRDTPEGAARLKGSRSQLSWGSPPAPRPASRDALVFKHHRTGSSHSREAASDGEAAPPRRPRPGRAERQQARSLRPNGRRGLASPHLPLCLPSSFPRAGWAAGRLSTTGRPRQARHDSALARGTRRAAHVRSSASSSCPHCTGRAKSLTTRPVPPLLSPPRGSPAPAR